MKLQCLGAIVPSSMRICCAGTLVIPKIKSFRTVVCLLFVCLVDDNLLVKRGSYYLFTV